MKSSATEPDSARLTSDWRARFHVYPLRRSGRLYIVPSRGPSPITHCSGLTARSKLMERNIKGVGHGELHFHRDETALPRNSKKRRLMEPLAVAAGSRSRRGEPFHLFSSCGICSHPRCLCVPINRDNGIMLPAAGKNTLTERPPCVVASRAKNIPAPDL